MEFVGCLSALAGGVAIGAMYLGLEPKQMAVGVLRSAGLLEQQTVDAPPAAENASAELAEVESATFATPVVRDDQSLPPLPPSAPDATAANETSEHVPQAFAGPAAGLANALMTPEDTTPLSDAERLVFTEAYWQAVDRCMRHEVDERLSSIRDSDNWQLFDYLRGRQRGHEEAAATIAALDTRGVDDHVLAYAKKTQKWHEDGGRLFARAVDLLTDAPSGKLSGPFAQSWQSAATQHRMEARLLEEKHTAVTAYLNQRRELGAAPAASTEPPTTAAN